MIRNPCVPFMLLVLLALSFPAFADATLAKEKGEFWLMGEDGNGETGVRDEKLIEQIYPGYGQLLASDTSFWKDFFSQAFSTYVWLPEYSKQAKKAARTFIPWLSCFSLIERHGADVVIFGSSETFSSLVPSILKEGFASKQKIVMCSVDSMQVEHVYLSAKLIQKINPKRLSTIVWGYSLWNAYTRAGANRDSLKEKLALFQKSEHSKDSPYSSPTHRSVEASNRWPRQWFPPANWDLIAPFSVRMREWSRQIHPVPETYPVLGEDIHGDEAKLLAFDQEAKPYFARLLGMRDRDCDLTDARLLLKEAIGELEKVSDRIVLYVPPTRLMGSMLPPCFRPAVDSLLASVDSERVDPIIRNWENEGIGIREFLWQSPVPDKRVYNFNHLNYQGATRFTRLIVRDILREAKDKNISKAIP